MDDLILGLTIGSLIGVGLGYGVREIISRRRLAREEAPSMAACFKVAAAIHDRWFHRLYD
jgi:hypothetical protein